MLEIDQRCTALTRIPGRRPAAPISSAGVALSIAVIMSGQRYQASAALTRMYAETGMRRDSSAVRSAVIAPLISAWYAMSSSAWARLSATDDAFRSRAVDFDGRAVGGLVPAELRAHHARQL